MKPLSDSELQDWLDGQLNLDANQLDANAKKDAALYDKIYAELKADEHVAGATFGFSNKVMREVFLETERKKDRKQFLLISALLVAIGMMAAAVIFFFNISVAQLFANQSPMQLFLFVAFGLAVLAAIQYADKRWVRK
ncbi:MAG: hypothetical protein NWS53_08850 [Salibacteraceae bacterium]|nr:hypothetical protein [Salibacteraceae bacterium]